MFDLPMKTSNADLSAVPVPLPGRVMMFAGQGGAPMVRMSDGVFRGFRGYSGLWGVPSSDVPAKAANAAAVLLSVPFAAGQLVDGALVPFRLAFWVKPATAGTLTIKARVNGGAWVSLSSVAVPASPTSKKSFLVDGMATVLDGNFLKEFCAFQNATATPGFLWADATVPGVVAGQSCVLDFGVSYSVALAVGECGVGSAWAGVLA